MSPDGPQTRPVIVPCPSSMGAPARRPSLQAVRASAATAAKTDRFFMEALAEQGPCPEVRFITLEISRYFSRLRWRETCGWRPATGSRRAVTGKARIVASGFGLEAAAARKENAYRIRPLKRFSTGRT